MLNFDALGSGRSLGVLELTDRLVEIGEAEDIRVRSVEEIGGATSDDATFINVDIPAVMFASDDFSRIHTPNDTLEFIEPRLLGDAATLALALLDSLDFWRQ